MASFSNQTKTEICAAVRKPAEQRAFLTGILLSARRVTAAEIVLQTECEALASMLPKLIRTVRPKAAMDTEFRTRSEKMPVWTFTLSGDHAAGLLRALAFPPADRAAIPAQYPEAHLAMLAAGCFVMGGSVTDPARRYHLELVLPDAAVGRALQQRMAAAEPPIPMKTTTRKTDCILYLKQNEQISDTLTWFGASLSSLELVEQQVYKSFRSKANRRLNCDLANIDRTVAAGSQQASDIALVLERIGLDALPPPLQEIAQLRLADPDANLRDLGALCDPPISRSGVHHRLQRLSVMAEQLRGEKPSRHE